MSDIDRTELRRLLEEAETPWTIEQTTPNMDGPNWQLRREGKAGIIISAHEYGFYGRGELIVAAVNALPDLLDALDAIHELADQIADHYGDNWDHTPACMGEPACPLCLILHIAGGGTPDEDRSAGRGGDQ